MNTLLDKHKIWFKINKIRSSCEYRIAVSNLVCFSLCDMSTNAKRWLYGWLDKLVFDVLHLIRCKKQNAF